MCLVICSQFPFGRIFRYSQLFSYLEWSSAELTEPNNGKASILCEANRLVKDLFGQIECLRKEHASLLTESRDVRLLNTPLLFLRIERKRSLNRWQIARIITQVDIEKNELREETSALASQIEKLQSELQSRAVHSKPDLNTIPPQAHFSGECLGLPVMEPTMQQTHAVIIVPVRPDLPSYPAADATQAPTMATSHVSKPHARYPTPADSWPAGLLKLSQTTEQPSKEFLTIGCKSITDIMG